MATKAGLSLFSRGLRYRCEDAAPTVSVLDVKMALVQTAMTDGRGRNKLTPEQAAQAVMKAIERGQTECWVSNTRVLKLLHRWWPALAFRLLRNG